MRRMCATSWLKYVSECNWNLPVAATTWIRYISFLTIQISHSARLFCRHPHHIALSVQVRKCLLTGLAVNIAELQRETHYMTLATRKRCKVHPSSILAGKPRAKFVLFTELITTGQRYMRTVSAIEPEWIDEVVPNHIQINRLFSNGTVVNGTSNGNVAGGSGANPTTHTSNGTNGINGVNGKSTWMHLFLFKHFYFNVRVFFIFILQHFTTLLNKCLLNFLNALELRQVIALLLSWTIENLFWNE